MPASAAVEHPFCSLTWLQSGSEPDHSCSFGLPFQIDSHHGDSLGVGQSLKANLFVHRIQDFPQLGIDPRAVPLRDTGR